MVSIIIPARNEVYLKNTIENILVNARGEVEVLVMLDGYLPDPPIDMKDERVVFFHYPQPIGQRQCINEGVRHAKGHYVMKLDAHCAVDEGFDVKLAQDCAYDWTVVPRMYNLDVETWKPKLNKRTDYMYISSMTSEKPFRAQYYNGHQPQNALLIDDTMCCMGPGWFMHKDRFWQLGGMDEAHGGWGQMGIEVSCKAWLSGGALKVNKKTWFAHWFRGGIGFPYHLGGRTVEKAREYSRDLWLGNKWDKAVRKFDWIVDKFNPPTWGKPEEEPREETSGMDQFKVFYDHVIRRGKNLPRWHGIPCIKLPTDLILYAQALWENKPDVLIECGTGEGGSTLFYADMFNNIGNGHVISIDMTDKGQPEHPRITYINGRMTTDETLVKVRELVKDKTVMVVLDGNHMRSQVKRELYFYSPMVTQGQFIVVEDIYQKSGLIQQRGQAGEAVDWFFRTKLSRGFKKEPVDAQFLYCISKGGWLRRT
jgi:cephalosporin hydroxylase